MAYTAWSVVFGEQPSAAKWNQLGANDALFYSFLGDTPVWQAWTPTWNNLTISSSSVVAAYTQIGKTVFWRLKVIGAGSFAVAGDTEFTLPVAPKTTSAYVSTDVIGSGICVDNSASNFYPVQVWVGVTTSRGRIIAQNASGTYLTVAALAAGVPFAWAVPDEIHLSGCYEAA